MNGMKARSKKQEARREKGEGRREKRESDLPDRGQRPEGRNYGPIHGPVSFDGEILVGLVWLCHLFARACYHILTMVVSPLGWVQWCSQITTERRAHSVDNYEAGYVIYHVAY